MRLVILTLALTLVQFAIACDSVNLGLRSYHWDRLSVHKEQPQNKHLGLIEKHVAIGCTNMVGRWDALYFRNSKNRDTLFLGDEFQWKQYGPISVNFDYGVFIHGYSDEFPAVPVVLPKLSYECDPLIINFYILYTEAVAIGLEFNL